jgi:hypothetical protein
MGPPLLVRERTSTQALHCVNSDSPLYRHPARNARGTMDWVPERCFFASEGFKVVYRLL